MAIIGVSIALAPPSTAAATQQIWLLAGQSNMIGYGTSAAALPAALQQAQPNVKIFSGAGVGWANLAPGFGNEFGPELTFGRDMAAASPGDDILLVKSPFGLGNLYNDWRSPNTGRGPAGPHYVNFLALEQAALASRPNAQLAGMIWMQGEGDGYNELSMAASYAEDLRLFIQSLRKDLNAPKLPFVIGQISNSSAWAYGAMIQQAQADVARTVSDCYMVTTGDLPLSDNMHYTSQGQMELGSRFARQAQTAIGVPEPSAMALLGIAVMGLSTHAWRKRMQATVRGMPRQGNVLCERTRR